MAEETESKSFTDLLNEVVYKGICGQCGGCVSFCLAADLSVLKFGDDGHPCYIREDDCLKDGICYMICPHSKDLDEELAKTFRWTPPIGHFKRITVAQAVDPEIKRVATDGGVVTALLAHLLENGVINGALVAKKVGPFAREPSLVRTRRELIESAGFYFLHSEHLGLLGEKYTTYTPMLSSIKGMGGTPNARLAFVGVPCQIRTIRKMQLLKVLPAHTITFIIGLFCWENFMFEDLFADRANQDRLKVDFSQVKKLNIKDDFIITLSSGKVVHIPFDEVDKYARPACLACTEFSNDFADLSVGGLAVPDGYTTIVLRSDAAVKALRGAVKSGDVRELKAPADLIYSAIVEHTEKKQKRGHKRLAELGCL
ncbi:MAG: Coenzyme F420 hydrogenase/dehydrogenase, beta subunit C-terminal domain [bacterium]